MKSLFIISVSLLSLSAHALNIDGVSGFDSIYGRDNREFVSKSSPIAVQRLSKSVAYVISHKDLDSKDNLLSLGHGKTLIKSGNLMSTTNVCEDTRFAKEQSMQACSSFLIAPDIMVTAGHCIEKDECHRKGKKFIFGVSKENSTSRGVVVRDRDIYSCKKILHRRFEMGNDYAIVKLDRKVTNRLPLKMSKTDSIDMNSKVFMIGHPMGLAQMYSGTAAIYHINKEYESFFAKLDSFQGNSGSPVFNAKTLEVEGVLISGQEDLEEDISRKCNYNVVHDDGGEGILRIKFILDLLK